MNNALILILGFLAYGAIIATLVAAWESVTRFILKFMIGILVVVLVISIPLLPAFL